jgi:hypothetical protein
MSSIQPQYLVLNDPAGADVTYSATTKGFMTLGQGANSTSPIKVLNITSVPVQDYVAETLQAQTLTPTAATAGITTQLTIGQLMNGVVNTVNVEYTVGPIAESATTICDALRSIINALTAVGQIQVTAGGTGGTMSLTAVTGYPVFVASLLSNITTGAITAGVAAVGKGADLVAQGFQSISEIPAAGTNYDLVVINYGAEVNDFGTISRQQINQLYVYYKENGTNAPAFRTALSIALFPVGLTEVAAQLKKTAAVLTA